MATVPVRRSWKRRLTVLPAAFRVLGWLTVVEVGVRTMPLPRLGRLIGVPLSTDEDDPSLTTPPEADLDLRPKELRRLRALAFIAPRWPFCDGPCLRQSLVAGRILRHRRPHLRLGVTPEPGKFMAHAWLEVEGLGRLGWAESFEPLVRDGAS
jgi:hypothetical protein